MQCSDNVLYRQFYMLGKNYDIHGAGFINESDNTHEAHTNLNLLATISVQLLPQSDFFLEVPQE